MSTPAIDEPALVPTLAGAAGPDGWIEEVVRYRASPREKSKFHTVLDAKLLFGTGGGHTLVTTRVRAHPVEGEPVLELSVSLDLGHAHLEDRLVCTAQGGFAIAANLTRVVGEARRKEIDFAKTPWPLPASTYPEVLLPFLMRAQPRDGKRRALYAWTSDRFVARVYCESRGVETLVLPAGRIDATEVWMYPDLNDWVRLGSVISRMVKPLLPRYEIWYETAAPYRCVRFEGSYGPPGAPEIILELV